MKVLLVGVGTVGEAIARLSAGKPWLEQMVIADDDLDRARGVADSWATSRPTRLRASTHRTWPSWRRSLGPMTSTWS